MDEERAPNVLKTLVVGLVVGITSMLPGISGATMCVVFNIYERLVRDLADLRHYLKKDFRFILLVIVGVGLGIFLCAVLLDNVLDRYPVEALMFFIGLIVAQLIPIGRQLKTEEKEGKTGKAVLVFALGFGIMMVMVAFEIMGSESSVTVSHDVIGVLLMVLVGVIIAVSALLPGLSHSTVLLVCGLMDAFIASFADLDFFLLIPMILGTVGGVLGFSKVIDRALKQYNYLTTVCIFGLTVGSVFVIGVSVAHNLDDFINMVSGSAMFVLGMLLSIGFMKIGSRAEY